VIHRVLVWAALGCSFLVFASFSLFARDQLAGASKHQVNELATGQTATSPTQTQVPPIHHKGQPRRFIDGAAAKLESPFTSIVGSANTWVDHMVPAIFALIVYGLGIGWLARFANGLAHGVHREGDPLAPPIP
jgi:hypothetical protein